MGTLLFFGTISLIWGVVGLVVTVAPMVWITVVQKTLNDPGQRFWFAQAMFLMGLVLIIGTSPLQWFWLWVSCGVILVLKGCFLLGASSTFRDRLGVRVATWPMWLFRLSGVLTLGLSVLLAGDIILYG